MNRLAIKLIALYRWLLSPLVGNQCRFYPTCSCYATEAFEQHSFFKASCLTLHRIWRCQPFYPGGEDPVPPVKASR